MENGVVTITQDEYNSLLEAKIRNNIITERLYHNAFMSSEDILWLLNTELSVELAQELREKDEKRRAEHLKKYGSDISYDE